MNRFSRIAVLVIIALWVLAAVASAPALADSIGGVIVIPGSGTNLDPLRLRTSAGCPMEATAYYATMHGRGFPPDGQTITSNTQAGLSHRIGFDVYVALVMQDYANANHTTLAGRYDITVYCINHVTQKSYGEFTGSLEFTSPTTYQAIGAAKPMGPPPPPLTDPGSVGALDPVSPPNGPASAPETPVDPRIGQLNPQRNDVSQGVLWLILVLAGAVFGALVAVVISRQIGKRSSS
jgi:hypothetical protein